LDQDSSSRNNKKGYREIAGSMEHIQFAKKKNKYE